MWPIWKVFVKNISSISRMTENYLKTALAQAYDQAQNGESVVACKELTQVLSTIPSALAKALYVDLCRIQVAIDDESAPTLSILDTIVNAHDPNDVLRLHMMLIDNGQLVERVADSVELPAPVRMRKWKSEQMDMRLRAKVHSENSKWHALWSAFLYTSRKENEDAYNQVLAKLRASIPEKKKEWHDLMLGTPESLQYRPNTFWAAIQVNRCSILEKRAICHKLTLCKNYKDGKMLQKLNERIMYEIYTTPVQQPASRRGWLIRCMRMFWRRKKTRDAVTCPNHRWTHLPSSIRSRRRNPHSSA